MLTALPVAGDTISKPELDGFKAKYAKNARPVQPGTGRAVEIAS